MEVQEDEDVIESTRDNRRDRWRTIKKNSKKRGMNLNRKMKKQKLNGEEKAWKNERERGGEGNGELGRTIGRKYRRKLEKTEWRQRRMAR